MNKNTERDPLTSEENIKIPTEEDPIDKDFFSTQTPLHQAV